MSGLWGAPEQESAAGTTPARRLVRQRWRDPRLAVGVLLVAGSVVLGARVLSTADDTTSVWTLREDLAAGSALDPGLVQPADVRFVDEADGAFYLSATEALPGGVVLARDTPAGELLARSGLEPASDRWQAELPLPVLDGALPPDLATGDHVDVWVSPEDTQSGSVEAAQVLAGVSVLGVERSAGSLAGGSGAVVLVALEESDATALPATLSAIGQGSVVLVRVSG